MMKKKEGPGSGFDSRGKRRLKPTELAELRAAFGPFSQTKDARIDRFEHCHVEVNHLKRVITVSHGPIVIIRIKNVPVHQMRKGFLELQCAS
jgi:hypothetical protein